MKDQPYKMIFKASRSCPGCKWAGKQKTSLQYLLVGSPSWTPGVATAGASLSKETCGSG